MIIGAASFVSVVLGGFVACIAERCPAHVKTLEIGAGVLVIGGLALLGAALPAPL